jgi:small-conductance mechanosensitive channel
MEPEILFPKIIYTVISIVVILVSRNVIVSLTKRYAQTHEKVQQRTNLVIKYFDFAFVFIFVLWNILIWGVNFNDVGLVFSSVFAVIGVAMFAQWSILSNITSGVVMFFTFPYKIGDKIKIHDKDFITEPLTIEDIRTFQTILRSDKGELLSYPNSLLLQKGITMVSASHIIEEELLEIKEEKNLTQTHD